MGSDFHFVVYILLFPGLYTTALSLVRPCFPQFQCRVQGIRTEDKADFVRNCLKLLKAVIKPLSQLLVC